MTTPWSPMTAAPATMPLREAAGVLFDATGILTDHACLWCGGTSPRDEAGNPEPELPHAPECIVARLLEAVSNA